MTRAENAEAIVTLIVDQKREEEEFEAEIAKELKAVRRINISRKRLQGRTNIGNQKGD